MNQSKQVLVVDDNQLVLMTTAILLRQKGFVVETASNGKDCLEKLQVIDPNIVLLDIMMPGMDGWEVLEKIRSQEKYSQLPVVIFTAMDGGLDKATLDKHGATGLLRKPFHLHQILKVMELAN